MHKCKQNKYWSKMVPNSSSNICISVDGQWGFWSTTCSVTCGSGTEYRIRMCDSPSPSDRGLYCIGNATELSQCHLRDCPGTCYI